MNHNPRFSTDSETHNPFVVDVLRALRKHPQGVKVYELPSYMDAQLLEQLIATEDYNLIVFRKNFWLMNALYQLQESLRDEGLYLSIGQITVQIQSGFNQGVSHLTDNSDSKLRDYYFNWENYNRTGSADVEALLKSFWQGYSNPDRIQRAMETLDVDESWGREQVKAQYRKLARQYHPDKGGDAERFIAVREAYEVLITHHRK